MKVELEREARILSGYRYGRELVNRFMDTLDAPDGDVLGSVNRLITNEDDPRKVEVFSELKDILEKKVVGMR